MQDILHKLKPINVACRTISEISITGFEIKFGQYGPKSWPYTLFPIDRKSICII